MAGQGAGLVDRPGRRDERHQVGSSPVRADRHPAADDLAEGREVGLHAEPRLGAAEAERGSPVMTSSKIEERPVGAGGRSQVLEEPGRRRDDAGIGRHRLDDDRGDPAGVRGEGRVTAVASLYGSTMVVAATAVGDAGTARDRLRRDPGAGLDEQAVRVAVVGARELDHEVPAGGGAREPQGAHDRLGARTR